MCRSQAPIETEWLFFFFVSYFSLFPLCQNNCILDMNVAQTSIKVAAKNWKTMKKNPDSGRLRMGCSFKRAWQLSSVATSGMVGWSCSRTGGHRCQTKTSQTDSSQQNALFWILWWSFPVVIISSAPWSVKKMSFPFSEHYLVIFGIFSMSYHGGQMLCFAPWCLHSTTWYFITARRQCGPNTCHEWVCIFSYIFKILKKKILIWFVHIMDQWPICLSSTVFSI